MPGKSFDVVVVGEINPDLILSGDVVPEFGQVEKLVENATLSIGSSSAIFACGAAKLGMRVALIGKIGKDVFGEFMRDSLDANGIDVQGIVEDSEYPTGISVILAKGNDRAILTYPGTIPRLKADEVDLEILRRSKHLHVGGYYLLDVLRPDLPGVFDHVRSNGLSISLDTNYDPKGKWDGGLQQLIDKVDVLLPNAVECEGISGATDLGLAIETLRKRVKYLGVKLGDHGAMLCTGTMTLKSAPIKIDVIDTVGAGDSFDAGFIYGYLAGWEAEKILKFANACGGISTRSAGGTSGQATLAEALAYI